MSNEIENMMDEVILQYKEALDLILELVPGQMNDELLEKAVTFVVTSRIKLRAILDAKWQDDVLNKDPYTKEY